MSSPVPHVLDAPALQLAYVKCCSLALHSNLRQHFLTSVDGRIKCSTCSHTFKCSCTSLRWHIQQNHPDIELTADNGTAVLTSPTVCHQQPDDPLATDEIWTHFTRRNDNQAECDVCMAVLSAVGSHGHSNLWKHLSALHPAYLRCIAKFLDNGSQEMVQAAHTSSIAASPTNFLDENSEDFSAITRPPSSNRLESDHDASSTDEESCYAPTLSDYDNEYAHKSKQSQDRTNEMKHGKSLEDPETLDDLSLTKKRSHVWSYYKQTQPNAVECLECKKSLKYSSTTSNLWKHVESIHKINRKTSRKSVEPKAVTFKLEAEHDEPMDVKRESVTENKCAKSNGKRRSLVWQSFTKRSPSSVECMECHVIIKTAMGTTSGMRKHIRLKHPKIAKSRLGM